MILRRISETGLRVTLCGFLLALLIPSLMLVFQAYRQLERDTFFQYRTAAEELARRIDEQLEATVQIEDQRGFSDYGFLVVAGSDFVQRSPLAGFPVASPVPGARSYFQIDADGNLSTPLVPARKADALKFGVAEDEYAQRLGLQNEIARLLSQPERSPAPAASELTRANGSTAADPAERSDKRLSSQVVLDRLAEPSPGKVPNSLGRVEDLKLDAPYPVARAASPAEPDQSRAEHDAGAAMFELRASRSMADVPMAKQETEPTRQTRPRAGRLEQNLAPAAQAASTAATTISLESFTSEVEPFRFAILDADNFVLYRTVWRDQARYVQGLVIARGAFLQANIGAVFGDAAIASLSDLSVAYEGELLHAYNSARRGYLSSAEDVTGTLLYQTHLSPPFNDLVLIFSALRLPVSAGSAFVMWTAAALVSVLFGGFWIMYRLGLQQITLNRQQQDFVSAVSHELKTPLTSIRMYGEILKAGWASEEKKRTYYDFIFQESERLSRLINNVLKLARLTRNGAEMNLQPMTVAELMDVLRSKIASQIEQAQFELVESHADESARLLADTDSFTQIMINLVDNAIKFSASSELHRIEISSQRSRDSCIEFAVRDYGPGIPKDQMRKIFELFYRTERELTRETVGTGIGLALVNELVNAMHGKVAAQNMDPGVEFRMRFPEYDGPH